MCQCCMSDAPCAACANVACQIRHVLHVPMLHVRYAMCCMCQCCMSDTPCAACANVACQIRRVLHVPMLHVRYAMCCMCQWLQLAAHHYDHLVFHCLPSGACTHQQHRRH